MESLWSVEYESGSDDKRQCSARHPKVRDPTYREGRHEDNVIMLYRSIYINRKFWHTHNSDFSSPILYTFLFEVLSIYRQLYHVGLEES